MNKRVACPIFVAAVGLLLAAAPPRAMADGAVVTESFLKTVPLAEGAKITLDNVHGSVRVVAGAGSELVIEAEKSAKAKSETAAREVLSAMSIDIDERSGAVTIRADLPELKALLGDVYASTRFTLTVPSATELEVSTQDGGITISGVRGRIEARAVNGSIDIAGTEASVDAHGANGGIHLEVAKFSAADTISAVTANGGIEVMLPADVKADVAAQTQQGAITTDFPIEVSGRLRKTRFQGELNGGGGSIELRTANGSIEIRKPS